MSALRYTILFLIKNAMHPMIFDTPAKTVVTQNGRITYSLVCDKLSLYSPASLRPAPIVPRGPVPERVRRSALSGLFGAPVSLVLGHAHFYFTRVWSWRRVCSRCQFLMLSNGRLWFPTYMGELLPLLQCRKCYLPKFTNPPVVLSTCYGEWKLSLVRHWFNSGKLMLRAYMINQVNLWKLPID